MLNVIPPHHAGEIAVSTSGGDTPLWSHDGRELFYRSGDALMAVKVVTEPVFTAGKPETLFSGKYVGLNLRDAR